MLHVHRAERADRLVDVLAGVLADPLADPLAAEVVAVHSRGIERWLSQELALRLGTTADRSDGISANLEFPFPGRLVGDALAAASGVDRDRDPWRADRLVWHLLALLEARPADLDLGPLTAHADDPDARFGAARRVVDLFDRYAVHRPEMLRAWHDGHLMDAAGEPLPADRRWQPAVWRALRDRLAAPSPAERLADAVDRLAAGAVDLLLPERVSVFGLTALPASYLEVLRALAGDRDVHLLLLHPSPVLWDRVAAGVGDRSALPPRDHDPTGGLPQHPLLASWGRDAREVQVVLASAGVADAGHHRLDADDPAPTLLRRIQAGVRGDRRPPGRPLPGAADERPLLAAGDRSLQVHSCHGRTRQVEVLRDAIGHLLAADADLEPRDIVVMCPDVEQFAPLVHAVFGGAAVTEQQDAGGLPELRVRIADRSLRQTNPLLEVTAGLLELADSRFEASRVLDLAGRGPVRRRFALDDDDLARFETWVADVGIRWGLDGDHRAAYDLAGVAANTWQAGLDRLLAGVAVADEDLRTVGTAVPYDDVEGEDIDRAGRLAELVARLRRAVDRLTPSQPVAAWRDAIERSVDELTRTVERDAWQRTQLGRLLRDVVDEATDADGEPCPVALGLAEVRDLLADRLRGRPSWANHRTGELTVCTLVPMRSVPHRIVCLLGMDDVAFPRTTVPNGDDLIDLAPRVGDRDERTEDRQLLLDALLAATDALVVTYTGRDERTNEPNPPAVPIGELLDVADATVAVPPDEDGRERRARDHVVVEHPLQPFDPDRFVPGRLGMDGPWSFDRTDLAGARALLEPRPDPPPFLPAPLPPVEDEPVIAIDDLVAFLGHPVRTFLTRRLGVRLPRDADDPDDSIPVELAPLDEYTVGDGLLAASLAGHDRIRWEEVERARGTLPPGRLAEPALERVRDTVDALLAAGTELGVATSGTTVEVDVDLPDGRSLVGAVSGVVGHAVVAVRYAKLSGKHQLEAYVQLTALTANDPERPWTALAIGRNPRKGKARAAWCRLGPLGDDPDARRDAATQALAVLVDLYDRGLAEPLPLYAKTSAAYAEAMSATRPDRYAAARVWDDEWGFPENADREHVLVLGAGLPYDALVDDEPPRDTEAGPDWPTAASRFEALALRLWQPILACREQGTA